MKFAVWTLSYIIAITKYNQNKFNPTNVLLLLLLPNESLHAKYFCNYCTPYPIQI